MATLSAKDITQFSHMYLRGWLARLSSTQPVVFIRQIYPTTVIYRPTLLQTVGATLGGAVTYYGISCVEDYVKEKISTLPDKPAAQNEHRSTNLGDKPLNIKVSEPSDKYYK